MRKGGVGRRTGRGNRSGVDEPFVVGVLEEPEQALGGRVGCPAAALEENRVVVVVVDDQTAPHALNIAVCAVNFKLEGALSPHQPGQWDFGVDEEVGEDLRADPVDGSRGGEATWVGVCGRVRAHPRERVGGWRGGRSGQVG